MSDPGYRSPRPPRRLPHPPEVYRRRRIAAAVIVLFLVIVLAVGLFFAVRLVLGAGSGDNSDPQALVEATDEPDEDDDESGDDESLDADDEFDEVLEEDDDFDDEPKIAEGPCLDSAMAVRATVDRTEYPVGDQPRFGMVITNIGDTTCARDLGPAVKQVSVRSVEGDRRIWVNTDCSPATGRDVWTLAPGDQAAFAITWSGTNSSPGCSGARQTVEPGEYRLFTQVGEVSAEPVTFSVFDPNAPEPEPEIEPSPPGE
ncbi:DUF4232 domain-containing protein [Hoyosella rhizosphaerae]|uniref:DUF4232 domain-containing protein n=1 Tax=Hoyosella rhizosphaerae TaxID=1755582 RepID=A0A916UL72_9ACTN|nr:DUF4232 domain-containing protein [Hoyosella rhizosphaerae]MBN4925302.1 DUF4232 domain-containing protein [Hoyosella rhizosphaerae]GGC76362.1 hypothetical protein GCM10011410_32030 [Hoyosella rhizosphaerae]